MLEVRRCKKCVMASTWDGITFDQEGVCNICRNYEKKANIDWEARQERLELIVETYKTRAKNTNNKYEAIVGFSGGKDSTFTLFYAVKQLNLKVLVVTFDHGFRLTPEGEWNLSQIPKMLDCDHIRFSIGNEFRNELCRKSSEKIGDFCIFCHWGVGVTAARISKAWDVPFQIWGESNVFGGTSDAFITGKLEEQDEEHFKKMFQSGTTPEEMIPEKYELRDLQPLTWPSIEFPLKAIYLGDYLGEWDQGEHAKIIQRELGWKPYPFKDFDPKLIRITGNYRNFDKVDCPYETVRNWQKFIRRGFDKLSFQCSKDIQNGKITREQALDILKYEGQRPVNMDSFCKETCITEPEFYRITKRV